MAEGPQQLLEVCGQRLSRFLCNAQHKHLAWLREVEEQGMRMLKSSFRDEPMLLPKTPSQRRKLRKRRSSWMREENKELSRRRPELEPNSLREKAPRFVLVQSTSPWTASPPSQYLSPLEQQAGNAAGSHVNPSSDPQKSQELPNCAKPQQNSSHTWMKGCKQALGVLWHRQHMRGWALSPLDEKHKTLANQPLSSPSPASKAVKPLKSFLQGQGGGIKDFIKCNTPTRPLLKGDFVEKERQRLESLRKKQEAEEQRKKKVEEEKRRRQAEMKQKREERLRKAMQARERAEQMEEKKKKQVEQKILQSDEKQENEQQQPLQKRRENEVKERGKTVLELKNLLEQQQLGQAKERDPKQRGKEKPSQAQQEPAALSGKDTKTSLSTSCLGSLKVAQGSGLPSANKNSYGLDLNSDDSTDDESNPRKTVPAWADGAQLQQAIVHQYYYPVDVDALFGAIPSPRLEHIFYKSKPRYFKRTSSAVWHSPPGPSCTFQG